LRELLGLGGPEYAGSMPRVRLEVDFRRPVRFGEWLDTDLWVAAVGVSSVTFAARISCEEAVCAEARVVAVLRGTDGQPRPWSDADRRRWLAAGPQGQRA
jgi:acyl-CoA thioesterase FadM